MNTIQHHSRHPARSHPTPLPHPYPHAQTLRHPQPHPHPQSSPQSNPHPYPHPHPHPHQRPQSNFHSQVYLNRQTQPRGRPHSPQLSLQSRARVRMDGSHTSVIPVRSQDRLTRSSNPTDSAICATSTKHLSLPACTTLSTVSSSTSMQSVSGSTSGKPSTSIPVSASVPPSFVAPRILPSSIATFTSVPVPHSSAPERDPALTSPVVSDVSPVSSAISDRKPLDRLPLPQPTASSAPFSSANLAQVSSSLPDHHIMPSDYVTLDPAPHQEDMLHSCQSPDHLSHHHLPPYPSSSHPLYTSVVPVTVSSGVPFSPHLTHQPQPAQISAASVHSNSLPQYSQQQQPHLSHMSQSFHVQHPQSGLHHHFHSSQSPFPDAPQPSKQILHEQQALHDANQRQNSVLRKWMTPAIVSAGYAVLSVVSEGSFGTVLRASRLEDHVLVALKAVPKHRLSEKECATIRKQAFALRTLKHRYIVDFHDDFEDDNYFYHVFEFLHGGDLYDRLEARGKPFSEAQVLFLARQIFYAVSYLHSKRAAHRDIKLENFVFETSPHDERQIMKLIDFDLLIVRSRQSPRTETCSDMCGTILYVSPEIASGREHVPEESDMWACGVMLYVLLSYQMPFQGATGRQILRAVRSTEPYFGSAVWANVSADTKALVKDLLNKDAAERPTADQALDRVKLIQAQERSGGSSSRLRALTRGLRSVSLNLWDGSGHLVRRVARNGANDGESRLNASLSGQLEHLAGVKDTKNGGDDEHSTEWMPHAVRTPGWRGSGRMEDDRNGRKRREVRLLTRAHGSRRARSQLRKEEDASSVSVASSTLRSNGVNPDMEMDMMLGAQDSSSMLGHPKELHSLQDDARPSDASPNNGCCIGDINYDDHQDSITSPSLAGMMRARTGGMGVRKRGESGSYGNGHHLGMDMLRGTGRRDDSKHAATVAATAAVRATTGGPGVPMTEVEMLRSSRRLRKNPTGLGARLRQWMHKTENQR